MAQQKNRPLKVFLCHAKANKPPIHDLYIRLLKDGVNAWLDSEDLIPGQNWELEIPKVIRNSDVVLVCLSKKSINKEGFVQSEIKIALDKAWEMPEGRIFLIPVRLEKCNVPTRLNSFQWVDLFDDQGYDRLIKALKYKAEQIGLNTYIKPQEGKKLIELAAKEEKALSKPRERNRGISKTTHQKSILLFGGNKNFPQPIMRRLRATGFTVSFAETLADALCEMVKQRFHLIIAYIRFEDDIESRKEFLQQFQEPGLQGQIPVILVATNTISDRVSEAVSKYPVFSLIRDKTGYRNILLNEVERAFREEIHINFNLRYDQQSSDVLSEVIKDIHWPDGPPANSGPLVSEAQDLIGKLFENAETIYLKKLQPGSGGTGLVQVSPSWSGRGFGPVSMVKVARLDTWLTEKLNYEASVKKVVPLPTTQFSFARSQHLGATLFSYSENISNGLIQFDDYYQMRHPKDDKAIEISLQSLFFRTCRSWYDQVTSARANLQDLYFQDLNLDRHRVIMQLRDLLPDYDPTLPTIAFSGLNFPHINPLYWLKEHERQCILTVKKCVTHGDMTGQNIMVDRNGTCWLIDFERTGESHSLRDFVMLETDLKYRLGPHMSDPEFMEFEKVLYRGGVNNIKARLPAQLGKEPKKLYSVINTLRQLACQVAFGSSTPSQVDFEYKISLLMATLNVIRLRHIPHERKLQALHSASIICETLK